MSKHDNSGALFKNDKKREGKSDADYQGQITIGGKEYWVNGWVNTSANGNTKYISLKVKEKTGAKATVGGIVDEVRRQFPAAELDDMVPF